MVFLTRLLCRRVKKTTKGPDKSWRYSMYFRMSWHYYGRKRNCFALSIPYVNRALRYSTVARKQKKIDMKKLWETRLSAACAEHGIEYPTFMTALTEANVQLNRKVLHDLSIYEPRTFQSLVLFAKKRQEEVGLFDAVRPTPPGIMTRSMLEEIEKKQEKRANKKKRRF